MCKFTVYKILKVNLYVKAKEYSLVVEFYTDFIYLHFL